MSGDRVRLPGLQRDIGLAGDDGQAFETQRRRGRRECNTSSCGHRTLPVPPFSAFSAPSAFQNDAVAPRKPYPPTQIKRTPSPERTTTMAEDKIIGIDLGTTNSVVAIIE